MPPVACRQTAFWGAPKLCHGLVPLQDMDTNKKPAGSSHTRSSAAQQDQSSSSPLAQVRVNLRGFALPRVGNRADGTSPSPLDKPWEWPQRRVSQDTGAYPSCHCRAGDAQWEVEWLEEVCLQGCSHHGCSRHSAVLHTPAGPGILAGRHGSSQFLDAHMFQQSPDVVLRAGEPFIYIPEYSSQYFNLIFFFFYLGIFPHWRKTWMFFFI